MARPALLLSLGLLLCATAASSEVGLFTIGYESPQADLDALGDTWRRDGGSGLTLSCEWLWLAPSLRWMWLHTTYRQLAASDTDGASFHGHALDAGPGLYVDLFPVLFHVGSGLSLVRADLDATATRWQRGGYAQVGVAVPARWRLGLHGLITYRRMPDYDTPGGDIALDGFTWRVGLAFLPDEDSPALNWAW